MQVELNKQERDYTYSMGLFEIGLWDYDVIEDKALWSEKTYEIYGINRNIVPKFQELYKLIHPEDKVYFLTNFKGILNGRNGYKINYRILMKDGSERTLSTYSNIILDENGRVVRILGATLDLTKMSYFNHKLLERLNEISENLDVGVWSKDIVNNRIVFCSKGIETICGYSSNCFKESLLQWESIIHQEDLEAYQANQKILTLNQKAKHQYRIFHKNGEVKWVQDETIPVTDMSGLLYRIDGIVTDITEQKKTENKMDYLAHHDYLTGLSNRRLFEKELNKLFETLHLNHTKECFSVMYLDIDGFKKINDTFGHLIGDRLLTEFSSRLKKSITEHNLVSRMSVDEFSAIIKHFPDRKAPTAIAEEIIDSLEEPFCIDGYELLITTSIGIATCNLEKDDDVITLMKKAYMALHYAKYEGKNNYKIYDSSMEKKYIKSYNLERDLRKAISKKEFILHYQPKVNTKTRQIVGGEALIRWNHYKNGMISPGEFIPVAEDSDLIFKITDWTFRSVCEQVKKWEQIDVPIVPISINISPKRFLKNDWIEVFIKIIKETEVNPKYLELEVTETAVIENDKEFAESIKELKDLGISISIDDFGTGYSSLIYLNKFMIDTVKMDQYLINSCLTGGKAPIAKYTIDLAHELGLNVVAEGVETEIQLEILREYKCDQIQGFLFSKPVPVKEFTQLLGRKFM